MTGTTGTEQNESQKNTSLTFSYQRWGEGGAYIRVDLHVSPE